MLEIACTIASKFKSASLTCYIPHNSFERIVTDDLLAQFHNSSEDIRVENTSDYCASLVLKNCNALAEMNATVLRLTNSLVTVSDALCFTLWVQYVVLQWMGREWYTGFNALQFGRSSLTCLENVEASMACYRNSFTFFIFYWWNFNELHGTKPRR
jgi:hypothetical protein